MEDNSLNDNAFMKNLCDDIYICIRGLRSELGPMYITARQNSQGRQRSYNPTDISGLKRYQSHPTSYMRGGGYGGSCPLGEESDDEDAVNNVFGFEVVDDDHEMSQRMHSAYVTPGCAKVMRTVSSQDI